jgi:hypothetical protein
MSAGHLSRQFRLAYGESPYGYPMTRRIERAMALLRRGDLSVTEVCFAVGCSSLGTFSSGFTGGDARSRRRSSSRLSARTEPGAGSAYSSPMRARPARGLLGALRRPLARRARKLRELVDASCSPRVLQGR